MKLKILPIEILLLSLCLLTINTNSHAQDRKSGRVEIEISSFSDDYFLLPVGNKGLLLFGEGEQLNRQTTRFEFSKYDVYFQKEWQINVDIDRKLSFQTQYFDESNDKLYIFMSKQKGFVLYADYLLIELDINTAAVKKLEGRFETFAIIKDLTAHNGVAYLGGHLYPSRLELGLRQNLTLLGLYIPAIFGSLNYKLNPLLLIADFNNNSLRSEADKTKNNTRISGLSIDKNSKNTHIFYIDKKDKDHISFSVNTYDSNHNKANSYELLIDGYDLTSGKVMSISSNEQIIIGTYSLRPKKYKERPVNFNKSMTNASVGFYYAKIKDGRQEFIRTYPFNKLHNFYKYLNERAQMRMLKKIERSKTKSKEYHREYNLLVHDLIPIDEEFIMLAEAYYPEYEQRCYYRYNPSTGYSEQTCYTVFVGFRFTHAIVAAFDKEGLLKWDNSFPIWDVLTYQLKPQVRYLFEDNEMLLLYAYKDEIKTQVLSGNKILENKTSLKIDAGKPDDKYRTTINSGIEHWYDNYFIAYGYQRLKNNPKEGQSKKRLFYFSKIAYR